MSKILNDLYSKGFRGVRVDAKGVDKRDFREARIGVWSDKEFREALAAHDATVGAIGGPGRGGRYAPRRGIGAVSYGGGSGFAQAVNAQGQPVQSAWSAEQAACAARNAPGCANASDPACLDEIPCHAQLLGWTTLEAGSAFPVPTNAQSVIDIAPETTNYYKPAFLFFEARQSSNFAGQPGLLLNATINSKQLISSKGYRGGITTEAFSVDTPLDVRTWDSFGTTNDRLQLTLGNFIPGETLHFFGIFWGDNVPCFTPGNATLNKM